MPRSRLPAVCVALLALSGCTSESATPPPDLAFELVTHTGSFHAGQRALDGAEHRMTGECMAAQGLPYPVEPRREDTRTDEERAIDMDGRRSSGYGVYDSRSARADVPSGVDRHVAHLPEKDRIAYRRALFGDERDYRAIGLPDGSTTSFPARGCVAEARAALFGDVVTWARAAYLPQTVGNMLARRVTDDQGYAAAMAGWRTCMTARGHRFASPDDAVEAVSAGHRREGYTPARRAYEVAVAVADGECARAARVPDRVLSLKKKYLRALPDDERRALTAVADAWSGAVAAAKRIV